MTLQYLRSMLPYTAWRHPMLTTTAHVTTWIWVAAFTASALLYLIPWSAGVEMHIAGQYDPRVGAGSSNGLAVVFRIVMPIVLYVVAALITRIWPMRVVKHVSESEQFDWVNSGFRVVENPLHGGAASGGGGLQPAAYVRADGAHANAHQPGQWQPPTYPTNQQAPQSYVAPPQFQQPQNQLLLKPMMMEGLINGGPVPPPFSLATASSSVGATFNNPLACASSATTASYSSPDARRISSSRYPQLVSTWISEYAYQPSGPNMYSPGQPAPAELRVDDTAYRR